MAKDIKDQTYYQDWKTVLIPRIQEDRAWADLFDGLSAVFAENIYKYIEQLRYIRDPDRQDKEVNIQQAEFLGFKYKSDLFSDAEYANLVKFLNIYNRRFKGTQNFIDFIGWIKNANFKIVQLWARGKKNYGDNGEVDPFSRETSYVKNNSLPDGTGRAEWYPTSHYDLEYNAEKFNVDESDVWYLFYKCAPIHLVLRGISAVFTADTYPLYMHLGSNDYTNTNISMPCIYRYYVPLYQNVGDNVQRTVYISGEEYYGTEYQNTQVYNFLPYIDKNMVPADLGNGAVFSRDSNASCQERDTYYLSWVGYNVPRFEYLPEFNYQHHIALGLLIEDQRTNLLPESGSPRTRTLFLAPGIYSFSGKGNYRLWNVTDGHLIRDVENSSYTFELEENTQIRITPTLLPEGAWYQLELGTEPTSYILTTAQSIYTRFADNLSYPNLSNFRKDTGSFKMKVSTDRIAKNCTILKVNQSQDAYVQVIKEDTQAKVQVFIGYKKIYEYSEDFTGEILLSLKPSQLTFNTHVVNFQGNNCPYPKWCYVGSDNGKNCINGRLLQFNYFPCYI